MQCCDSFPPFAIRWQKELLTLRALNHWCPFTPREDLEMCFISQQKCLPLEVSFT